VFSFEKWPGPVGSIVAVCMFWPDPGRPSRNDWPVGCQPDTRHIAPSCGPRHARFRSNAAVTSKYTCPRHCMRVLTTLPSVATIASPRRFLVGKRSCMQCVCVFIQAWKCVCVCVHVRFAVRQTQALSCARGRCTTNTTLSGSP